MQFVLRKDGGDGERDVTVTGGDPQGTIRFEVAETGVVFDLSNQGARKLVEELRRWLREGSMPRRDPAV